MCIVYSKWNFFHGLEYFTLECEKCSKLKVNDNSSHRRTKRVKQYNLYSPLSTRYKVHIIFVYYICFGLLFQSVLCNNALFNHLKPEPDTGSSSSKSSTSSSSSSKASSDFDGPSSSSSSVSSSHSESLISDNVPLDRRSSSERCPINECQYTSKYFDEEDCRGYRTIIKCLQQRHIARPCHGFLIYRTWQSTVHKYMKEKHCASTGDDFWPGISQPNHSKNKNMPWTGVPQRCPLQPGLSDNRYDGSSLSSDITSVYDAQRIIESSPYVLCSLFGRSHLLPYQVPPKTSHKSADSSSTSHQFPFPSQMLQTCSLEGAWPLLDNRYVTIQVTARRDLIHSTTAFSQVTVIIKGYVECVPGDYHSYTFLTDRPLPSTLDSGQRQIGQASLRIRSPGTHVEILLRHIGTIISLRLFPASKSVAISVRIPRKLVEKRPGGRPVVPQLCSTGCPSGTHVDERLVLSKHPLQPRQRTVALADAEEACRAGQLKGEFLDACVFDTTLGEGKEPVNLAVGVFDDVRQLKPSVALLVANRTRYKPYIEWDKHSGASQVFSTTSSIRLLILCAFLVNSVLFVNR